MDDLISRQSEIDAIRNAGITEMCEAMAIDELKKIPPKKGRWIEPTREGCLSYDKVAYAECSECGKKEYLGWGKNYCPNCGSFMGEEDEQSNRPDD